MGNYKNMTKDELIKEIEMVRSHEKELIDEINQLREIEKQYELLKYLYDDYVIVKKDNDRLRMESNNAYQRINDLEDLCNRQQHILDNDRD